MAKSGQLEYEEIQPAPRWTYLVGVIVMISLLLMIWYASTTNQVPAYLWVITIVLLVLFVFIFANFARMKIVITATELDVSYGVFHRRIPRKSIKTISDIDLRFKNTGGIGIRLSTMGYTVYNSRWGKGLRVDRNDGGKPLGFSADSPEQIKQILISQNI